jgi:hypothetical protein
MKDSDLFRETIFELVKRGRARLIIRTGTRNLDRRFPARFLTVLLAIALSPLCAPGQQKVVDQILTLVNDDIITRSDLLWSIALIPNGPSPVGPVSSDLLLQKLDVMIDERLIAQEAVRVAATEVTIEEIDKEKTNLISQFRSEAAFRERAASVGLTSERIDDLLRQRIIINKFIDFRFRSFVFVTDQDIQKYYEERHVPEVRKRGAVPPPLEDVRNEILAILREEKINQEINRWLIDARQRADIVHLAEP